MTADLGQPLGKGISKVAGLVTMEGWLHAFKLPVTMGWTGPSVCVERRGGNVVCGARVQSSTDWSHITLFTNNKLNPNADYSYQFVMTCLVSDDDTNGFISFKIPFWWRKTAKCNFPFLVLYLSNLLFNKTHLWRNCLFVVILFNITTTTTINNNSLVFVLVSPQNQIIPWVWFSGAGNFSFKLTTRI